MVPLPQLSWSPVSLVKEDNQPNLTNLTNQTEGSLSISIGYSIQRDHINQDGYLLKQTISNQLSLTEFFISFQIYHMIHNFKRVGEGAEPWEEYASFNHEHNLMVQFCGESFSQKTLIITTTFEVLFCNKIMQTKYVSNVLIDMRSFERDCINTFDMT